MRVLQLHNLIFDNIKYLIDYVIYDLRRPRRRPCSRRRSDAAFCALLHARLKVIERKHLHTDFSLPEARVVYELAHRASLSPGQLAKDLDIDAGQLSRLLLGLEQRQVITRTPAASDKRQVDIVLTAEGRNAFADLNARTEAHVEQQLQQLDPAARARVVGAMGRIEHELGADGGRGPVALLRTHRPGDIGWIISRHGALYHHEYGWDISFEELVAEIAAQFLKSHDPRRERCWIAEVDGEPVGTVMLVRGSETVAKLRLLIVEAVGARARHRPGADQRVPPLRPRGGLHPNDAVDAEHPRCGAQHLSGCRFSAREGRAASQLRP